MPSVLAIVSKAIFEQDARGLGVGDVWRTERYASQNKVLGSLEDGDNLYLVTVRPPETLWLVAVLESPKRDVRGWLAEVNATPIRDIHAIRHELTFSSGQPMPTASGKLGMSLQTPRVLTDDAVAILSGERTIVPQPKPAPKNTVMVRSAKGAAAKDAATKVATTKGSDREPSAPKQVSRAKGSDREASAGQADTKAIRDAIVAGKHGDALVAALALWAREPSGALAQLIDQVSETARMDVAGIAGKSKEAVAAWAAQGKKPPPMMVPALLATLPDARSADAADRVALVAKWPADPRVDAALVGWLEAPPYHATMTKPFWTGVFERVRKIRDPRVLPRLEAADGKIAKAVAATMATWLRTQLAKVLADLRPQLAGVPADSGVGAALGDAAATMRTESADLDALLDAVYADPAAEAPRLVYADALTERGDVRGEFITVQMRLAESPDDKGLAKREKELLEAHGKQWLGPLAPIVMADYRFERGFLAACSVDGKKRNMALAHVGDRAWTTLHTFDGPAAIALHPSMRGLRTLHYDCWEEDEETPEGWRDLLVTTERPLETLHLDVGEPTDDKIGAVRECAALPQLEALYLRGLVEDLPILADTQVAHRLRRLGYRFDGSRDGRWVQQFVPLFEAAPVPVLEFEITHSDFHPTMIRVVREDKKSKRSYARVEMEIGPTTRSNWSDTLAEEAIKFLRALGKLHDIRIKQRRAFTAHERLAKAMKSLKSDGQVETWSVT